MLVKVAPEIFAARFIHNSKSCSLSRNIRYMSDLTILYGPCRDFRITVGYSLMYNFLSGSVGLLFIS